MYSGGVMPGPADRVRCWLLYIHGREHKKGQQKVQLYYEDDPLCLYSYIIYLCSFHSKAALSFSSHRLLLPGPRHPSEAYTLKT